eukprot:scaffold105593_cov20-Tisochrysis_lutea.AAC.2
MGISAQPGAAVMSWVLHGNVRFIVPIAPTAHEGLYYAGNKRRDYGEVVHAGRGLYERGLRHCSKQLYLWGSSLPAKTQ